MQLIKVPDGNLNLYYKKGRVGDDPNALERLEEWKDVDGAVKEFVRLFEEVTGNDFEPWEREKKFQKKPLKFYPIDMDDGVDVRCGGLGLRQLGVAATHCKLEPTVANFMKILCSQEIYRYALMEMDLDAPDLPMGMLSNIHLKKCEEVLLEFVEKLKSMKESGPKAEAVWSDFSQRWFTLMHSVRPFIFRDYQELADHCAASFECVRDIVVASHVIGHMGDDTLDDPLSDRYKRIGCTISPVDKDSDDYKMILNYVEKTYEPVKVADIEYEISVENIFSVETKEGASFDEVKKLANKRLLWCGTRSSNLLRHLHKGFQPASCSLPVPGYMFGKGIVCSDAAAEAARYGFTAVDRPEGFLVLAVFSQGEEIIELKNPPEDTKQFEEKKVCVKGLGRKKPDESEFIDWKDDIKVPCGRLIPSEHKDSPLEYNEYTVYDPKQSLLLICLGILYPYNRGTLCTVLVILYSLSSVVAGYTTASFHCQFAETGWERSVLLAGIMYAGPLFVIGLNLSHLVLRKDTQERFLHWHGTGKLLVRCFLGVSYLLVLLSSSYNIYMRACGDTLTLPSILFIMFIILILLTAILSVGLTYIQLSVEDHQWWWRSVLCGGSTSIFMFVYCIYFYARSSMSGLLQFSFVVGYNACMCYAFFLMLGTVGSRSSLIFVRYIY
ncbi:hypothetical protein V6N12_039480 [Hibiscus sabdariffa]|uniref:Poly [ADP-ribose] polymerase n=1 Tax=Hibiscus sabdariffa TaxID=183260 RepID=A0ABR2E4B0_9ROSI